MRRRCDARDIGGTQPRRRWDVGETQPRRGEDATATQGRRERGVTKTHTNHPWHWRSESKISTWTTRRNSELKREGLAMTGQAGCENTISPRP